MKPGMGTSQELIILRVIIGSTACVHTPKDIKKLDSNTRNFILLGCESVQKVYGVFDPITQKISHSRK